MKEIKQMRIELVENEIILTQEIWDDREDVYDDQIVRIPISQLQLTINLINELIAESGNGKD